MGAFSRHHIEKVCRTAASVWWKPRDKVLASGSADHWRTIEHRPELVSTSASCFFQQEAKSLLGAANTPMKWLQEVVVACQSKFTSHDSLTWTPGCVLATDFLHQPLQGQRSCLRWSKMSASHATLHIISDRWKCAESVILFVLFAEQRTLVRRS